MLKQPRGDNLEGRETALSWGHALKVDVKIYKENQDQMAGGIMERLLTTRLQRIIIRSLGYKRSLEEYKRTWKKDFFLVSMKSSIDFYIYFLIVISL